MRALELIRSEFQERTWTAFWRLTVEGHTAAEIGAELGMKSNSVRQAKFRVMQRLRTEFGDLIDLPD
jgi:RNA polymerase sigma-70 factor (ECF subfamily)